MPRARPSHLTAEDPRIAPAATSYQDLASEYYDPRRHPTCDNFREASRRLLETWLPKHRTESEWLCEVGAGRSLVAEILAASGAGCHRVLLSDISLSMLKHSLKWRRERACFAVADARMMPLNTGSVDVLISSLGDPYNGRPFWREVNRVLRLHAQVYFTVPAYDWAVAYRDSTRSPLDVAVFDLADRGRLELPSYVLAEHDQRELVESCGFLVEDIHQFRASALRSPLSAKLLVDRRGRDASAVTGYWLTKVTHTT